MARISLVVATIGRVGRLDRLLASLARQRFTDAQIIIADQNPPSFLAELLTAYRGLDIDAFEAPHGVSAARNAALRRARGDILGFPDDDCWYEPETLSCVVEAFDTLPGCDGAVGVSPAWLGGTCNWDVSPGRLNAWSIFRRTPTWAFFVRRKVVDAIGGFDTTLGPGPDARYACGEDTDLLIRAQRAGFDIRRHPAIRIHHPEPDFYTPEASAKAYAYGRSRGYLLRKHGYGLGFKALNCLQPALELLRPMQDRNRREYHRAMLKGRFAGLLGEDE